MYNSLYPGATFKKTANITTSYRRKLKENVRRIFFKTITSKPSLQNHHFKTITSKSKLSNFSANFMTLRHWF
jgi:hypothetical protein